MSEVLDEINNLDTECEETGNAIFVDEDIQINGTLPDDAAIEQPFQLLKNEKKLLLSCLQNCRKRGGQVDWDRVEKVFETNADDCKIFKRRKKRLQSSVKKYHSGQKGPSDSISSKDDTVCPTHDSDIEENLLLVGVRHDDSAIYTDNVVENDSARVHVLNTSNSQESDTREESVETICEADDGVLSSSVTHITQSVEQERRLGALDDDEREFVKSYGKKCMVEKKNIDNSRMLKQYKAAFPGYSRDGDVLKRCWNNWKKDSTAYKEFLNSLKKE